MDSLVLDELSKDDRSILENSLKNYHIGTHDTDRINALHNICEDMMHRSWEKYQFYQDSLLTYFLSKNVTPRVKLCLLEAQSSSLNNLGIIYNNRGQLGIALSYYQKSLLIDEELKDKYGLATGLNNIAMIYQSQGNISKALKYYHQSLKLAEKINYKEGVALGLNNIAYNYHKLEDFEEALKFYNKSFKIYEKINDKDGMAMVLNNLANVYGQQNNLKKARSYLDKSYKIREEMGDKAGLAILLNNYAVAYEAEDNYEKALEYHLKSLIIDEEMENTAKVSVSLNNIGTTYFNLGNLIEAKKYALKSMEIAKELEYPVRIGAAAELLSKVYNKEGKGVIALKMYQLYISMRDSVNNSKTQKAAIRKQTEYEYEKQKALDDAENDKLVAIEKEAKRRQKIISYTTAGGLGLTGVFLFFVFNRLKITRQQKNVIEEQKLFVETQKEEVEEQRDIANEQKLIVEEKNKEILDSITYAKRIQEAILPPPRLVKEWLTESFIFYKPKDIVAGDFYWMETATYKENGKDKTLVYFAAADCTGHGVPGAMVSVVCANALNRAIKEFNLIEPGHVLDKVTELVVESFDKGDAEIKDGMDIALCALDISAKKVFYSGANNPLYRITGNSEKIDPDLKTEENETHQLIEYKANKQPIGFHENTVQFNTLEIQLEPGDAIYVFSDGFPDQFGGIKGKKYKYSSFRKCLLDNFHQPMETQKQLLENEFDNWKGDLEQVDDVCVIGVKINGVEKNNFTKRELEVLVHLQEGLPSKLIADKMFISKHTVDTYRRRLLAKSGTYNSTELINYCIKKEII